jgi:hypothetical protein
MVSANQRDLIGGGFKIIFFGTVLYFLISELLIEQIDLIYPYVTYEMVDALYMLLLFCFAIPGILLIPLAYYGKFFDLQAEKPLPKLIQVVFLIVGILVCGSVLGIRTGVSIFLNIKELNSKGDHSSNEDQKQGQEEDQNEGREEDQKEGQKQDEIQPAAVKSYKLYLISAGIYLLVFGLFFIALINFLLVITIPLLYPTLTQPILIGIEVWIWLCMMVPAILFLVLSFTIKEPQEESQIAIKKKIILVGAILAMVGIFGFSHGVNLIKSQWMLHATPTN